MCQLKFLLLLFPLLLHSPTWANERDADDRQVMDFAQADTALIRQHLIALTKTEGFRLYSDIEQLDRSADYIFNYFERYADTVHYQTYEVKGRTYRNVIASFAVEKESTVVVGAHYDVCGNQAGADDNASGVVGLLELARMMDSQHLTHRIDLVAYTLEEPPFFRTSNMGSAVHARSLIVENRNVYGMVVLEMIGFFKDEKKTQNYPVGILKWIYGSRGNYITAVNKFGKGKFARKFSNTFKRTRTIRTKKITAPAKLEGIDFSDHLNYWNEGISATMITDTGFMRNYNYHQTTDTMETLDIPRMAKVINGVLQTLIKLK